MFYISAYMLNQISFRKLSPIATYSDDTTSFKLRTDKKYPFIQKICCFIMKKLGAYNQDILYEYQSTTIDTDDFIKKILEQQQELMQTYGMLPKEILIGSADYAKLMNDEDYKTKFSFGCTYHYGADIFGLKVNVIPWMEGILIMPEERTN
jgi:hypothetical protein